jgi:predicted metal-dependent hydrolase
LKERELLSQAVALWDEGRFYDAHEVLEDIWRLFPKEDRFSRNCYQGIIRLAIAYNHYICSRRDSALRVLRMVQQQLSPCGENFRGIDVKHILEYVERHIKALEMGEEIVDFPKLLLLR